MTEEELLKKERILIQEFIAKAAKMNNPVFTNDGKENIYLNITLPDLITLLQAWGKEYVKNIITV